MPKPNTRHFLHSHFPHSTFSVHAPNFSHLSISHTPPFPQSVLIFPHSRFSILLIFQISDFAHSSFSVFLIFRTPHCFHVPNFPHSSHSIIHVFHTPICPHSSILHSTFSTHSPHSSIPYSTLPHFSCSTPQVYTF